MFKRQSWPIVVAAAIALVGCQVLPEQAPPATVEETPISTVVAVSTETMLPPSEAPGGSAPTVRPRAATTTALPTETATATPTPLPAETPDPNTRVGEMLLEETFSGRTGWGWGYRDDSVTIADQGDLVRAQVANGDSGWRVSLGPDIAFIDQQSTLTIANRVCEAADEVGLAYRAGLDEANGKLNGYVFKITCGGTFSVDVLRGSQPSTLIGWTATDAIRLDQNALQVWVSRGDMKFFINGQFVGAIRDNTYTAGRLGLYVRDRSGGGLDVAFTDLTVRQVRLE